MEEGHTPLFIVGASRSGTTMLRLIFNAHSQVAVPDELEYFPMWPASVAPEDWRAPNLTATQYEQFVHRFLECSVRKIGGLGLEALQQKILEHPGRNLRSPYRLTLEAWAEQQGKPRWGEKTPRNLFYSDVLADMFPEARFICLVRDPRAVVYSMNRISYFSEDTVLNALNWRRAIREGHERLEASIPASQRITVRYEELVRAPEEQVQRLCTFAEVAFEPGMLDFHRNARSYIHDVQTPSVTKSVQKQNATKWKEGLAPSEIGIVESICRDEMKRWGYQPTAPPPGWPGRLDRGAKEAYWYVQRWRHAGQRDFLVSYPMFARTRNRLRRLFGVSS